MPICGGDGRQVGRGWFVRAAPRRAEILVSDCQVTRGFLSPRASVSFDRIEPYGLFIIVGLLATGVLWKIVGPVIFLVSGFFFGLVGA